MWHANDKKSVGRNSPADYEGKRCSAVSYSTGKLGKHLLSRPFLCRPKGVSVCSVVKNTLPSGHHVDETARKPTSKPLSVPPCLRLLRINQPEANRTPRAEGGAGTSRAKHTLPTRSYTQTHFISAEQRLHTAAICNHTT